MSSKYAPWITKHVTVYMMDVVFARFELQPLPVIEINTFRVCNAEN